MKEETKRNIAIGGSILLAAGVVTVGVLLLRRALRTIPKGVDPVRPFKLDKFMGKWYEIARTDNRFEKGLKNVTIEFTRNSNKTISVLHKGDNPKKEKSHEEKGRIAIVDKTNVGKMKISFRRPLYSGYNVIEIDPDYRYALVVGDDLKQLWLLSRRPDMLDEVASQYLAIARSYGYNISNIVWVDQDEY